MTIEGDWWPQVRALQGKEKIGRSDRFLFLAQPSEELAALERDVLDAVPIAYYVAVGKPYLDLIAVSEVSKEQSGNFRQLKSPVARFNSIHRFIKSQRPAAY